MSQVTFEKEITRDGAVQAFMSLRRSAQANNLQDMSLDEINAEIEAARSENSK